MHLGRDRVIAAYELERGVIVDPGPTTCVGALLDGLGDEPRALLLTHIHLDHAGAAGALVRRFPELRVYVHDVGAPHLVDPSKLLASARRLYGDEMDRLWGEVATVPAANLTALSGGETVEGCRVLHTPGHASHHVSYLDPAGDAYVGDLAGVRVPPGGMTLMPTPPPDIDVEAWERSLDALSGWGAARLFLTHFGPAGDPGEQLELARRRLREAAGHARDGDRERFVAWIEAELDEGADPDAAERFRQAAPPDQLWMGLERYWRVRETAPSRSP